MPFSFFSRFVCHALLQTSHQVPSQKFSVFDDRCCLHMPCHASGQPLGSSVGRAVRQCVQELGERGNLALARRLLQRAVQNRITRRSGCAMRSGVWDQDGPGYSKWLEYIGRPWKTCEPSATDWGMVWDDDIFTARKGFKCFDPKSQPPLAARMSLGMLSNLHADFPDFFPLSGL